MNPALWKLYRLRVHGSLRSMRGKLKTVRGAALALFTLLFFLMTFGQNLVFFAIRGSSQVSLRAANTLHEAIPLVMLVYLVTALGSSIGERAIYFSPSEIDFLFPGPFSRRQILLYKILGSFTAAMFIALLVATSLLTSVRSWPAAVFGLFLAKLFINSLVLCAQLAAEGISERVFTRARRWLLGGFIIVAAILLTQVASRTYDESWQQTLQQVRHRPIAELLLAPFEVYARIITAERMLPDAMPWAALGAVLVAGVYAVAVRLDANYLETAVRVSQQIHERIRRASSEGAFAPRSKRTAQSSRVPKPPWLGGAGPLAWRQLIQALRSSRGVVTLAALAFLAMLLSFVMGSGSAGRLPTLLPWFIVGTAAYLTFLISAQVPLGFRGDHERMDLLRSLPIRPLAIVSGQLVVVVILLSLLHGAIFGATALAIPSAAAPLVAASFFALPFNWILFGTENFLFLLYPSPIVSTGSEGFLRIGRLMLFMLVKSLVLTTSATIAALPSLAVYFLSQNALAASLTAFCLLLIPSLAILLLVTWAFSRYDVSDHLSD